MGLLGQVPDLRTKPMREVIYERLRQAIVYGELKPHDIFTDEEIAKEFNVSRTPAREALQKLESTGYLLRIPKKGNKVLGVSPYELAHSYSIRKALETLAVRYTALRISKNELLEMKKILSAIDNAYSSLKGDIRLETIFPLVKRFNEIIFEACKSARLMEAVWTQREIFDRYRVMRIVLPNRLEKSINRRHDLYEAFVAHDPDAAFRIWTEHLDESFAIWREKSGYADELKDFIFF